MPSLGTRSITRLLARADVRVPWTLRLLLLLALATVVPLGLLLQQIGGDMDEAEGRATTRARWVAHRFATDVGDAYGVVLSTAQTLARLDDFWEATDVQRDDILDALASGHPVLGGLAFFTSDLAQHGSNSMQPGAIRFSLSDRAYAAETVATGQPAFAETMHGTLLGLFALPVAVPIRDDGFLEATFRIDRLTSVWANVPSSDASSVLLVDGRSGQFINMSAAESDRLQLGTWPNVPELLAGDSAFHMTDESGQDMLVTWEPVPNTPWIVLVQIPTESLFGPIRAQALQRALVPVSALSLLGGLLFVAWQRVHQRTAELAHTVAELRQTMAEQESTAAENALLQAAVEDRGHQLEQLVARLFSAQEEERRRIAYEVHDGLAQIAAATHQRLESLAAAYHPRSPRTRHDLQRARELARRTVAEARRVIAGLRPAVLDDFGLPAALQHEAEQLRTDGFDVRLDCRLRGQRLPNAVDLALYRVAQEALTNVRKHAPGSRVRITLDSDDVSVRLSVKDDGQGFDQAALTSRAAVGHRVGVAGMRERVGLMGGHCEVDSRPGHGTTVRAELPLTQAAEGARRAS